MLHAQYRECGCSHSYPAVGSYEELLALAAHLPIQLPHETFPRLKNQSVRLIQRGKCYSAACMRRRLLGHWVMVIGDSTQRMIFQELLDLLSKHYGYDAFTVPPTVRGLPERVFDAFSVLATVRGLVSEGSQRVFFWCFSSVPPGLSNA